MQVERIPVSSILVKGERAGSAEGIEQLAESIEHVGLIDPVTVTKANKHGAYYLVAGRRRLAAIKSLGQAEIDAIVQPYTPLESELAEIDENLQRLELTAMEWAEATARRVEILVEMAGANGSPPAEPKPPPGEQKRGTKGRFGASNKAQAVRETAEALGVSEKTVKRQVNLSAICRAARDKIRHTRWADNQTALAKLSMVQPQPRQVKVASLMAKKDWTPEEAIRFAEKGEKRGKRQWPDHLDAAFSEHRLWILESLTYLNKSKDYLCNKMRGLAKGERMKQLDGLPKEIESKYRALAYLITDWAIPTGPCPYCKTEGHDAEGETCEACKGDGWLPEGRLRSAQTKDGMEVRRYS